MQLNLNKDTFQALFDYKPEGLCHKSFASEIIDEGIALRDMYASLEEKGVPIEHITHLLGVYVVSKM